MFVGRIILNDSRDDINDILNYIKIKYKLGHDPTPIYIYLVT